MTTWMLKPNCHTDGYPDGYSGAYAQVETLTIHIYAGDGNVNIPLGSARFGVGDACALRGATSPLQRGSAASAASAINDPLATNVQASSAPLAWCGVRCGDIETAFCFKLTEAAAAAATAPALGSTTSKSHGGGLFTMDRHSSERRDGSPTAPCSMGSAGSDKGSGGGSSGSGCYARRALRDGWKDSPTMNRRAVGMGRPPDGTQNLHAISTHSPRTLHAELDCLQPQSLHLSPCSPIATPLPPPLALPHVAGSPRRPPSALPSLAAAPCVTPPRSATPRAILKPPSRGGRGLLRSARRPVPLPPSLAAVARAPRVLAAQFTAPPATLHGRTVRRGRTDSRRARAARSLGGGATRSPPSRCGGRASAAAPTAAASRRHVTAARRQLVGTTCPPTSRRSIFAPRGIRRIATPRHGSAARLKR